MAESHDLLAIDSYWETLGLNGLRKQLINYVYLLLILDSPRLEVGYMQFPLLTAHYHGRAQCIFTIAIVKLLSQYWYYCSALITIYPYATYTWSFLLFLFTFIIATWMTSSTGDLYLSWLIDWLIDYITLSVTIIGCAVLRVSIRLECDGDEVSTYLPKWQARWAMLSLDTRHSILPLLHNRTAGTCD